MARDGTTGAAGDVVRRMTKFARLCVGGRPTSEGRSPEDCEASIRTLLDQVDRGDNAMRTLGAVAQGQCESALGLRATHTDPALGRVGKARTTLAHSRTVVVARAHEAADQALWRGVS